MCAVEPLVIVDSRHRDRQILRLFLHRKSCLWIDERTTLRIDEVSRFGIDRESGLRVDQKFSFAFALGPFDKLGVRYGLLRRFDSFNNLRNRLYNRLLYRLLTSFEFLQDLGNQRSLGRFCRGYRFFCRGRSLDRLRYSLAFDRFNDRRRVNFCTIFRRLSRLAGRIVRRLID